MRRYETHCLGFALGVCILPIYFLITQSQMYVDSLKVSMISLLMVGLFYLYLSYLDDLLNYKEERE